MNPQFVTHQAEAGRAEDLPDRASILHAGRNCAEVAHARRVKLLVEGEAYFKAFVLAAERARERIFILSWDFDSRIPLDPDAKERPASLTGRILHPLRGRAGGAPPVALGDFLNFLVRRRRGLHVHVLAWDYPMIFGTDREFPPTYGLGWKPAHGVHFQYDNTHPVGGSHHQKIVVVDDAVAFTGGMDLTSRRWDTSAHHPGDPRRHDAGGNPYPPFHDLMAMVDGEAARALGDVARERWRRATGQVIRPATRRMELAWPPEIQADMRDVAVGVSRTMPASNAGPEVREVETLHFDLIASARRCIYVENQYFTAQRLCDALAARLQERDGPEIILVLRLLSHGWLEKKTMQALRGRLLGQLRAADRWHRLGIYYPHMEGLPDGTCIDVHSKVMIVDDEWLRVGSANLCNRSMGMDSECDLTFEARGSSELRDAIAACRNGLLCEHLDVRGEELQAAVRRAGSVNGAIAALNEAPGRTLRPLVDPQLPETLIELASFVDPEKPVSLEELSAQFTPVIPPRDRPPAWRPLIGVALAIAALAALWRFTPLAQGVTPERIIDLAQDIGDRWWAPLLVLLAYTPACLVMFPRPLITLFAVIAFGTTAAIGYSLSGIVLAALVTYFAGTRMQRSTIGRLAGSRLDHLSEVLRRRGLLAMTAVRLVPIAPFAVVGAVAGALRIRLWHYTLGSLLGLLPGTIMTLVFGDQLQTALRDPGGINYALVAGVAVLFGAGILAVRRFVFGGAFTRPAPESK